MNTGQFMAQQSPQYDNNVRKRHRRRRRQWSENQAMGKSGIIRPCKMKKAKYL